MWALEQLKDTLQRILETRNPMQRANLEEDALYYLDLVAEDYGIYTDSSKIVVASLTDDDVRDMLELVENARSDREWVEQMYDMIAEDLDYAY